MTRLTRNHTRWIESLTDRIAANIFISVISQNALVEQ
jgi:hypothetical protein